MDESKNNLLDELLEIAAPLQKVEEENTTTSLVTTEKKMFSDVIAQPNDILVPDLTPLSPQDDDIAYARKKMRNIITAAEDAYNELANIANETQQPRAYEVLATLLKTATDATNQLIATHKTRAEIKKLEQGGVLSTVYDKAGSPTSLTQVNQTIEKAVFVGTATEMMEKLTSMETPQIENETDGNSN